MSVLVADAYSDEEMACPAEWYGSYKEPWLLDAGDADYPLSDPVSGEPIPTTFRFTMADGPDSTDDRVGRLRAQLASTIDRYWSQPISFWMTSRANRALLGTPFNAFTGFLVDAQPTFPRKWEFTLADIVSRGIIQDELDVPWRKIGDGFLHLLDSISETLDREQAEPILYGRHNRIDPDIEPSTPGAFQILPIYLGIETVGGSQRHVWLVAGHACTSVTIRVDGVQQNEGSTWLVATQPAWLAQFGTPYVDKTSSTYGNARRYSLIYGLFGQTDPDECALGDKILTAVVEGIEDVGDGSGALITDYYAIYKHFAINFVANRGPDSYQSGLWLANPQWNISGETVGIIHEDSFDRCSEIALERWPGVGLVGAAAIGLRGRAAPVAQIIGTFNKSGFCRWGQTRLFRLGITTMHPTQADKDGAPRYTDVYEIHQGSFGTSVEWNRQATALRFRGDYDNEQALWRSTGTVNNEDEIALYQRNAYLDRDYAYIPGYSQQLRIAQLELASLIHPPRVVKLEQSITDDEAVAVDPDHLAYLNLGDYLVYEHFDAVAQTREERLAQIVFRRFRGSQRLAYAEAVDVEDLIGFDAADEAS